MHRSLRLAPLALGTALVLAGCAAPAASGGDDVVRVVASTNVYASIAEAVGGDAVEVTAIVSSASQDPHSFEPSAQDQLAVSRADLILENGGGYDGFLDALIEATGTDAPVLTAVEFSHDWPENEGHADDEHADDDAHAQDDGHDHGDHEHVAGFNEHVWYDPHAMAHFAGAIADELTALAPEHAEEIAANAAAFQDGVAAIEDAIGDIAATDAGAHVFVTEPVPLYLVAAANLENVTPAAFTQAVEEGQDVPPATLLEALSQLASGEVRVVIANSQTGGAETTQVIDEADADGIPVVEFAETLPEGQTYLSWMQENVAQLAGALAR